MDNGRIFIATFSENALKVARDMGLGLEINDLCISENLNSEKRTEVIAEIKREIAYAYGSDWFDKGKEEREKMIMHGPFTELTPAAIDPRALALMKDRYGETVDICADLGIDHLVLHDGYLPLIYQKSWHRDRAVEFWQWFSDQLPDNMIAYIENVFDDEPYLLTDTIERAGRENIKICLDVGHANCMTEPAYPVTEWVRIMAPYIGHIHIHNNDGSGDQHNDVFDGTMPVDAVVGMINDICDPEVTFTIESRRSEPSAEYLKNI